MLLRLLSMKELLGSRVLSYCREFWSWNDLSGFSQFGTKSWALVAPMLISLWMWTVPGRRCVLGECSFLQHSCPHRGVTTEDFLLEALPQSAFPKKRKWGSILQSPYMFLPSQPCATPIPRQPLLLIFLSPWINFAYSRMSYKWNKLFWVVSLAQCNVR